MLTSVERHHQPIYLLPLLHKLVTKYFPTGQARDTTVGVYIYKTQKRCAVLDQCWGFLYSTIRFGVTVQYHLKRLCVRFVATQWSDISLGMESLDLVIVEAV